MSLYNQNKIVGSVQCMYQFNNIPFWLSVYYFTVQSFSPETNTPDIYDISAAEETGPKSWKFGIDNIKCLYWFSGLSVCCLEFLNPMSYCNGF
jgi:hypothetical protein